MSVSYVSATDYTGSSFLYQQAISRQDKSVNRNSIYYRHLDKNFKHYNMVNNIFML